MRVKVAVIGGGSTGSSILYHLAKGGVKDCLLVERDPAVGSGQTGRSTALVRTHYSVPVVARMALLSYRFFKNFEREIPGYSAGYVETGLLVGVDAGSERVLSENLLMYREMGIVSRLVDRQELKVLEPMLDAGEFSSVVHEPQAGYAEPSSTASAFSSAAVAMGARVLTGAGVSKIVKAGDGYSITTSEGELVAEKVVLATGVWSGPMLAALGVPIPIKAVRHPVAIYKRPQGYLGIRPIIFDFVLSSYYKPEGANLLFVGSMESELDESSAAVDPDDYNTGVTFEEVERYSAWTSRTLPVMAGGEYERGYSGVYDNTPDQQPIIDELSAYGYGGLYCLVGLSGHGFKLSPEFGRIMASIVTEGAFREYDISAFRLDRFEKGKLLRGRYHLSTIG